MNFTKVSFHLTENYFWFTDIPYVILSMFRKFFSKVYSAPLSPELHRNGWKFLELGFFYKFSYFPISQNNDSEITRTFFYRRQMCIFMKIWLTAIPLTDAGEDSKLVHRWIWAKVCTAPPRYLFLITKNNSIIRKDEYDSAPGRKYTAHFRSFAPVSVKITNFVNLRLSWKIKVCVKIDAAHRSS